MTQLGWRPIQKCRKWVEPSEVEAWLQRDMEDWGTNHDITPPSKVQRPNAQCWLRARSLRVGVVEFGDELFGALYIEDGSDAGVQGRTTSVGQPCSAQGWFRFSQN